MLQLHTFFLSFFFYPVPSGSLLSQEPIDGSPQIPPRGRLAAEPERFTFGSVSSGRGTEEESSSCFDYTSDQVRQTTLTSLKWCKPLLSFYNNKYDFPCHVNILQAFGSAVITVMDPSTAPFKPLWFYPFSSPFPSQTWFPKSVKQKDRFNPSTCKWHKASLHIQSVTMKKS